jgi:hypothetical protein
VIEQKDEVKLGMQGFDNINAVFELDDHVILVPVPLVVRTILKLENEWRLGKCNLV